jgi:hypothetical protein
MKRLLYIVLAIFLIQCKANDQSKSACTAEQCLGFAEHLDRLVVIDSNKYLHEIQLLKQQMDSCECSSVGFGATPKFPDSDTLINDVRDSLPTFTSDSLFEVAVQRQMGIIGNDYRGLEEIGAAAVEREFAGSALGDLLNVFGASNINFWVPQRRRNQSTGYKRSLAGFISNSYEYLNEDILPDKDLNIQITPATGYEYLLREAVAPELTTITRLGQQHNNETHGCPDKFNSIWAEIDLPASATKLLGQLLKTRLKLKIVVYGSWVYDRGHCCQPEIHPSEQMWWSDEDTTSERIYSCFSACDASKRFWYRHTMDGKVIKPWAEPPVRAMYAFAFEVTPGRPAKRFELAIKEQLNADSTGEEKVVNLVYRNNTIVSFRQSGKHFKVKYEQVGISGSKIRGFLVLESSVGKLNQVATQVSIPHPYDPNQPPRVISLPAGSDPAKVHPLLLDKFFSKEAGYLFFTVRMSNYRR